MCMFTLKELLWAIARGLSFPELPERHWSIFRTRGPHVAELRRCVATLSAGNAGLWVASGTVVVVQYFVCKSAAFAFASSF